jgi:hypothetical protein
MTIPPRIIQTARSRDLPLLARAAATNLKLLHPGWEYLFFDDSDIEHFIANEFPEHRSVFDAFPRRIQRFDFFRYLAVCHHGGFYFHLDVFLVDRLDPLLDHNAVFTFEELTISNHLRSLGVDWEIGNYAFGASPRHPFLEAAIENCVRSVREPAWVSPMLQGIPRFLQGDFRVLNSTGPGMLTRTLVEQPETADSLAILFPEDVCDEASCYNFGTLGVHLMEGTWRTKRGFIGRRLAHRWESRLRARQMIESRRLGPKREWRPR